MCYNQSASAGMMELVDMRDLGDVTPVKDKRGQRRALADAENAGMIKQRRFSRRSYAGMMELVDVQDLGDVTSVKDKLG